MKKFFFVTIIFACAFTMHFCFLFIRLNEGGNFKSYLIGVHENNKLLVSTNFDEITMKTVVVDYGFENYISYLGGSDQIEVTNGNIYEVIFFENGFRKTKAVLVHAEIISELDDYFFGKNNNPDNHISFEKIKLSAYHDYIEFFKNNNITSVSSQKIFINDEAFFIFVFF